MTEYVELTVSLEDNNELLVLKVSPTDAIRAQNDSVYLMQLAEAEQERRRFQTEQEESQEGMLYNNEDVNLCSQVSVSSPSEEKTADTENETSLFIWSPQCVHLLLSLFKKHEVDFTSGKKRHNKIWKTIALILEKRGYKVNWAQCQSKLNGLKKTYRNIMEHNYTSSGSDRTNWPYFAIMNDLFGKCNWAQPPQANTLVPRASMAFASVATPSAPLLNFSACEEPKSPKRRKLETIVEKYSANMEVYISCRKEMEIIKEERHKTKIKKIEEMMVQKKRQHEEKMKVMNALLETISKNK